MLEARLSDGFPTEEKTAEEGAEHLLTLLLPTSWGLCPLHDLGNREGGGASQQPQRLRLPAGDMAFWGMLASEHCPECSQVGTLGKSFKALAQARPTGDHTTRPAGHSYTYASRALQAWGPAALRRRATWRLRDSGRTRVGSTVLAVVPEALRPPGPGCWPEGRRWLRRR